MKNSSSSSLTVLTRSHVAFPECHSVLDMAAGSLAACRGPCCCWTLLPFLRTAVSQTLLIHSLSSAALLGQVLWFLPAHCSSFFVSHWAPLPQAGWGLWGSTWKSRGNASAPFMCYTGKDVSKLPFYEVCEVLMKILALLISCLITSPFLSSFPLTTPVHGTYT